MKFRLTKEQRKVVRHREQPLRVIAGPGTGKTSCLAARIKDLIVRDRNETRKILSVTFTRAAAAEMRQKLQTYGLSPDRMPDVRTLHSKAVALLRRHHSLLDLSPSIHPLSEIEADVVLKDVAIDLANDGFRLNFRGPKSIRAYLRSYRSQQSGAGIPSGISRKQGLKVYRVFFKTYEELQTFYKALDWFRVVNLALQLLESHPDVLAKEQAAIDHLLVDEYQDLNMREQQIIQKLAGAGSGLCVVGDEDQSIYETQRFAAPSGLVKFDRFVAGTKTLSLTLCHRCPNQILEKANILIEHNEQRIQGKAPLRAIDPDRKGVVAVFRHKSKKAEMEWLIKKITDFHGKGFEYRDMLILFSEGKIAQDYISLLQRSQIPISVQLRVVGPFDSVCFLQMLATLHFLVDQADNLALRQCLDYWPSIGQETIRDLRRLSIQSGESLWNVVRSVASNPESYRNMRMRSAVQKFHSAMNELLAVQKFDDMVPGIARNLPGCCDDRGIKILGDYFSRHSGKETAMSLQDILDNFEQEREAGAFEDAEELPDRIRIMTMHSAKGLEAKIVVIPALEDDLMPGQVENIEERRRLFYVSVTRAKMILLLSWASQRTGQEIHRIGGRMLGKTRSQFLVEMGE